MDRIAGEYGATFLEFMTSSKVGVAPADVHIIGASLGAHTSAIAGHKFRQLTSNRVGRITGLDPSGPLHYSASAAFKWALMSYMYRIP